MTKAHAEPRHALPAPHHDPAQAAAQHVPLWTGVAEPVRRTMINSIWEGMATQVFLVLTTSVLLIGYARELGATPEQQALIATLMPLAQCSGPIAAWLQRYVRSKIATMFWVAGTGRALWVVAAMLPLLAVDQSTMIGLLVAVVLVSSIMQAMMGPFWAALMGDVVDDQRRGRYFGLRNGLVALTGVAAMLAASAYVDRADSPRVAYQIVFVVASAFAVLGAFLYLSHTEPVWKPTRMSLVQTVSMPLRDRNFRRFLGFGIYWNVAVQFGAVFVLPYFGNHLQLTNTQQAIWFGIASALTLAFGPIWGQLVDRVGNKPTLMITTVLCGTILPFTWLVATPGPNTMAFVVLAAVVDALVWSAINASIFNLVLATAPKDHRITYISVFGMAAGLAGFVGGYLSKTMFPYFEGIAFTLWGFQWTAYHWVFLFSAGLRVCAWPLLKQVKETRAQGTYATMRQIGRWLTNGFAWR